MIGNWLKLLRQPHLNITLQTGEDLETIILERPGLWMNVTQLAELRKKLIDVAQKTLSEKIP